MATGISTPIFSQSSLMSSVKLHIFLHIIPNQFKNLFLRVWIGFLSTLFITTYALNLIQSFLNTAARVLFCKGKSNSVTLSIHAQPLLHIRIMSSIKKYQCLGLTLNQLNQNLWVWEVSIIFKSPHPRHQCTAKLSWSKSQSLISDSAS